MIASSYLPALCIMKFITKMEDVNILTLILKLAIIFLNTYHHFMPLQILLIQPVNGMEITPLWNETSTGLPKSCIIDNSTAEQGFVSFQSSSHDICSLQINSSSEQNIFIEILSGISENEFLYVHRLDTTLHCPNQYVAIEALEVCSATFIHDNFQVNLKSRSRLSIVEIEADQSVSKCPEFSQNISMTGQVSPPSDCSSVRGYDNISMCTLQSGNTIRTVVGMCWFNFSVNCNVIIGKNEAILECPQVYRVLLLYPDLCIELMFVFNKIAHIDTHTFDNLTHLQALNLESTELVTLQPAVFERLHKLKWLSLGFNELKTLHEEVFKGLVNLEYLFMSKNKLTMLPGRLLQDLVNLIELRLDRNQLVTLNITFLHGLKGLKKIDLKSNKLSYLPVGVFEGLTNLADLWLKCNKLVSFDSKHVQDLKNLNFLFLEENLLTEVQNDLCQKLESLGKLDIRKNKLRTIGRGTFNGFGKPNFIKLSKNKLEALPADLFQNLTSLRNLQLGTNEIKFLDDNIFKPLPNLERLHIGGNKLSSIPRLLFNNLFKLKFLKLNSNKLTEIDTNIFISLANLEYLDMSANMLKTIPNLSKLTQLTHFLAYQNPIITVNMDFLSSLSKNTNVFVSQHEICQCYIPKVVVNCSADEDRSPYLTCDRLLSDRILVVAMWLIGLNAIVGNMFVLIWKQKHMSYDNRVQSVLLSNLALSDFLMGVYMILIASADIFFGESFPLHSNYWRAGVTCKIAGTLSVLSSEASVLFVTLISLDRFINIKFPYSTRKLQKRSTVITVVASWIFALALSVTPSALAGKDFKFYDNSHVCIGLPLALTEKYTKIDVGQIQFEGTTFGTDSSYYEPNGYAVGLFYSSALFLGFNALCYLLIFGCYIEIVRAVRTTSKQSGRTQDMKEEIRMTTKVAAIVATDFFCWAPIIVLGILVQIKAITLGPHVYAWLVTCVLPINSAINPYLYTIAELILQYRKKNQDISTQHVMQHVSSSDTTQSSLSQTSLNQKQTETTA